MDLKTLLQLDTPKARNHLLRHTADDPVRFVLDHQGADFPVAEVATQIRIYQRAQHKLPAWTAAQCLFTVRAYEQSTSERAAALKPLGRGHHAVDLTGGLGVDAWQLAQSYAQVTYVDADPVLCELARRNFARLGARNITVREGRAEDILLDPDTPPADLYYVDPDRRTDLDQRRLLLQDYSPDLTQLLPAFRSQFPDRKATFFCKLSPLLDLKALAEAFEPLGGALEFHVVGVQNEVKEGLVKWGAQGQMGDNVPVYLHLDRSERAWHLGFEGGAKAGWELVEGEWTGKYIYEPDAAAYKARVVPDVLERTLAGQWTMNGADGYGFCDGLTREFPGRVWRVLAEVPYKPKAVKKELKARAWGQVNFSRRRFDRPLKEVAQKLGVQTGGDAYLLLTRRPDGARVVLFAERLK